MAASPAELYNVVAFSDDSFTDYTSRIFTSRAMAERFVELGKGRRFMTVMPVTYSRPS